MGEGVKGGRRLWGEGVIFIVSLFNCLLHYFLSSLYDGWIACGGVVSSILGRVKNARQTDSPGVGRLLQMKALHN